MINEYPPMLMGTPEEQIKALRDYLIRMVESRTADEAAKAQKSILTADDIVSALGYNPQHITGSQIISALGYTPQDAAATVAIAHGGTGATTANGALSNLGAAKASEVVKTSDTIAIAHGGTGSTDVAGARTNLGIGKVSGARYNAAVTFDDVSMTSGAWTNLAEHTFTSGYLWIVDFIVRFPSNATGRRHILLASSKTGTSPVYAAWAANANAVNGANTFVHLPILLNGNGNTYYLNGYQNSGGALAATPRVSYIGIPMYS